MANSPVPHQGDVVTLDEARERGLRHYFTGTPCKWGHIARRQVCDRACAECKNARKRADYSANPGKYAAQKAAEWRRDIEKSRARSRENNNRRYHRLIKDDAVRGRLNEYNRARYYKNLPRVRELRATWARENRQKNLDEARAKGRAATQKRKALKLGSTSICTARELEDLRKKVGRKCAHCGAKPPLTIDHIVPLARGGEHSIRNIQFLCPTCNSSKNSRDPIEFARSAGRLL